MRTQTICREVGVRIMRVHRNLVLGGITDESLVV